MTLLIGGFVRECLLKQSRERNLLPATFYSGAETCAMSNDIAPTTPDGYVLRSWEQTMGLFRQPVSLIAAIGSTFGAAV
ncbi:hypothetical protein K239x_06320 [Planctomycetes bacterium K23_9]|uniref:Uncharacterized protein n=1 Tax=Stieleria marina TaxID=1930275 RepID=A0A517NNI6_9BACT|nr:hypothetical protein K239x_06320 [Planctomycetes bacterium K23_9]